MRLYVWLGCMLIAGCNQFFELKPTDLRDATSGDDDDGGGGGTHDARLIIPSDGSTTCGATPDFETWTYGPRTIPFTDQLGPFGPYKASNGEHLIIAPADGKGVWDVDIAANTSTQIPGLVPPSGKSITSVATSPDGAAIWFKIDSASYVAFRATGFARQATDLGLPDANEVLPAAVAYFGGELRMVARVRDTTSTSAYVELSSLDGVSWTRGATLSFGTLGGYLAAALSPDGCTLTFSHMEGGASYVAYRSSRDPDGTFGTPVKLDAASATGQFVFNPVLGPDNASMWFVVLGASNPMYRGAP
ncbi:MAG TPA: hypothetical protein VM052_09370 [Candidatus Limnocylindrales bacterium]|nr:hypothetical protein [Candidatus Limnocylindrales bacterium]